MNPTDPKTKQAIDCLTMHQRLFMLETIEGQL